MEDSSIAIFTYLIFTIIFPFTSILSFVSLLLGYFLLKVSLKKTYRRPISMTEPLILYYPILKTAFNVSLVVNSWIYIYNL